MSKEFTIQQVAKKTSLSVHALRYYEKMGLIHPIKRDTNGHRRYSETDLEWIQCIQNLRTSQIPISDIQKFIKLNRQDHFNYKEILKLIERHEKRLLNQIRDLQEALFFLRNQVDSYNKPKDDQSENI
ncbi:MerR family transcriptional regulator [Paenibacillus ehimensis]|uniref:MerR family transcriptional regulator n=1 Tax=Paenibacillus ehimensis TaxID=79264 RepID=UPI00047029DA